MNTPRYQITTFDSGPAWRAAVRAHLEQDVLRNLLMLAVGSQVGEDPAGTWLGAVYEDDVLLGALLKSPGHKLLVSDVPIDALPAVVAAVRADHETLPGVHGGAERVRAFADHWTLAADCSAREGRAQRIHVLRTLETPPHPATGQARVATPADAAWVHAAYLAFLEHVADSQPRQGPEYAERLIEQGRVLLWEDGAVVSMAARVRDLPDGASVSLVWTPPEARRKGYASAVVHELSRRILADGCSYSSLYTDLANPTSNHIYATLGYEGVADELEIWFDASEGEDDR